MTLPNLTEIKRQNAKLRMPQPSNYEIGTGPNDVTYIGQAILYCDNEMNVWTQFVSFTYSPPAERLPLWVHLV